MNTEHLFITDNLPTKEAQSRYQKRRQELAKKVSGIIIVEGIKKLPNTNYPWILTHYPHPQNPFFLFYTGIMQCDATLIIDSTNHNKIKEILFLPNKNKEKEFWEGPVLAYDENTSQVQQQVGIETIKNQDEKDKYLNLLIKNHKKYIVFMMTISKSPIKN